MMEPLHVSDACPVPQAGESLVCALCASTWYVDRVDGRMIHLARTNDTEIKLAAEISYCPYESPHGGVSILRPAPTRQEYRNALREALHAWTMTCGRGQREHVEELRRKFGL